MKLFGQVLIANNTIILGLSASFSSVQTPVYGLMTRLFLGGQSMCGAAMEIVQPGTGLMLAMDGFCRADSVEV